MDEALLKQKMVDSATAFYKSDCLFTYYTLKVHLQMSDDFDQQFDDDFDDDLETDEEEDFEEDFDDVEEETEEVQEEPEEDESYEASEDDEEEEEDFDKPVSEGETVEVDIEDLGSKGDGIARVEGFVVFVPGGEVGESYDVEITSVGRKFAFAEIVD